MSSVLGVASIEIVADASRLGTSLDREVRAAVNDVERVLSDGVGDALDSVGDLADGAFDDLEDEAKSAAMAMERSLSGIDFEVDVDIDSVSDAAKQVAREASASFKDFADRAASSVDGLATRAKADINGFATTAQAGLSKLGGGFTKLAGLAAGALGGFSAGAFLKESIDQAADLGESVNAINVVLGDAADGFLDFSSGAADSLGLTQAAVNQALIPTASLLKGAGSEGDALGGQLEDLATRAADVGSVFNKDVNEVLDALGAGLRGEAEPLRQFGVTMDEASLQAIALSEGIIQQGESLDATTKTQAAFALIMQQTDDFAGDFANTADGLPNAMKRLSASFTELQATAGADLLGPVAASVGDIIPVIQTLAPVLGEAFAVAATAITPLLEVLPELAGSVGGLVAELAGPLGSIVGAFAALVPALTPFIDLVAGLARLAGPPLAQLAELFGSVFGALGEQLGDTVDGLLDTLVPVFQTIGDVIGALVSSGALESIVVGLVAIVNVAVQLLSSGLAAVFEVLGTVMVALAPTIADLAYVVSEVLLSAADALVPVIIDVADLLADGLLDVIVSLLPVVIELADVFILLVELVEPLLDLVILLLDAGFALLVPVITVVARILSGVLAGGLRVIASALQPVIRYVTALVTFYRDLVKAFLSFDIGAIGDAFKSLANNLLGIVGGSLEGIVSFFRDLPANIVAALASLASAVGAAISSALTFIGTLFLNGITFWLTFFTELPGQLVAAIVALPSVLGGAFTAAFNFVTEKVTAFISGTIGFFTSLPERIKGLAGSMLAAGSAFMGSLITGIGNAFGAAGALAADIGRGIGNFVIKAINSLLDGIESGINNVIVAINNVPALPDISFRARLPNIPQLAEGGYARGSALVQIGEGGHDEAVLPFGGRGYSRTVDALTAAIAQSGIVAKSGPQSSVPTVGTLNISTPGLDPHIAARAVVDRLVAAGGIA